MKFQEVCECCGSVVTAYTHNLNVPLVKALRKLVDYFEANRVACKLQSDLELTHNQFANFQKLQYFGLVYGSGSGWMPTKDGIDFIHGEISIKNPVATMANKVLPDNHPAWATHLKSRELVSIREVDETCYKKREEYGEEKSRQNNLFN